MKPATTLYRLARKGGEYNRLYSLLRRETHSTERLGWPTVVAERGGRVVGFLSTFPRNDAVWAGPLVIEGRNNPLMFIRLVEAYENVLRLAGVTSYYFTVERSNQPVLEHVQEFSQPIPSTSDKWLIFKREIA